MEKFSQFRDRGTYIHIHPNNLSLPPPPPKKKAKKKTFPKTNQPNNKTNSPQTRHSNSPLPTNNSTPEYFPNLNRPPPLRPTPTNLPLPTPQLPPNPPTPPHRRPPAKINPLVHPPNVRHLVDRPPSRKRKKGLPIPSTKIKTTHSRFHPNMHKH